MFDLIDRWFLSTLSDTTSLFFQELEEEKEDDGEEKGNHDNENDVVDDFLCLLDGVRQTEEVAGVGLLLRAFYPSFSHYHLSQSSSDHNNNHHLLPSTLVQFVNDVLSATPQELLFLSPKPSIQPSERKKEIR